LPREYSSHGFFDLSAVKIDSIFSCIEKKIYLFRNQRKEYLDSAKGANIWRKQKLK